ncbi:hypothetical protein QE152_g25508 [Popillia japonica]|uniref:Uncharacterized protein n=1 Tax=Popillia japonica TaxID=7064 RepID=A0AAW1K2H2_POPJA
MAAMLKAESKYYELQAIEQEEAIKPTPEQPQSSKVAEIIEGTQKLEPEPQSLLQQEIIEEPQPSKLPELSQTALETSTNTILKSTEVEEPEPIQPTEDEPVPIKQEPQPEVTQDIEKPHLSKAAEIPEPTQETSTINLESKEVEVVTAEEPEAIKPADDESTTLKEEPQAKVAQETEEPQLSKSPEIPETAQETSTINFKRTEAEIVTITEPEPMKQTQEEPTPLKQEPQPQIEQFVEIVQPKLQELEPEEQISPQQELIQEAEEPIPLKVAEISETAQEAEPEPIKLTQNEPTPPNQEPQPQIEQFIEIVQPKLQKLEPEEDVSPQQEVTHSIHILKSTEAITEQLQQEPQPEITKEIEEPQPSKKSHNLSHKPNHNRQNHQKFQKLYQKPQLSMSNLQKLNVPETPTVDVKLTEVESVEPIRQTQEESTPPEQEPQPIIEQSIETVQSTLQELESEEQVLPQQKPIQEAEEPQALKVADIPEIATEASTQSEQELDLSKNETEDIPEPEDDQEINSIEEFLKQEVTGYDMLKMLKAEKISEITPAIEEEIQPKIEAEPEHQISVTEDTKLEVLDQPEPQAIARGPEPAVPPDETLREVVPQEETKQPQPQSISEQLIAAESKIEQHTEEIQADILREVNLLQEFLQQEIQALDQELSLEPQSQPTITDQLTPTETLRIDEGRPIEVSPKEDNNKPSILTNMVQDFVPYDVPQMIQAEYEYQEKLERGRSQPKEDVAPKTPEEISAPLQTLPTETITLEKDDSSKALLENMKEDITTYDIIQMATAENDWHEILEKEKQQQPPEITTVELISEQPQLDEKPLQIIQEIEIDPKDVQEKILMQNLVQEKNLVQENIPYDIPQMAKAEREWQERLERERSQSREPDRIEFEEVVEKDVEIIAVPDSEDPQEVIDVKNVTTITETATVTEENLPEEVDEVKPQSEVEEISPTKAQIDKEEDLRGKQTPEPQIVTTLK